ncbi:hypothetical protein N4227_17330 [Yersinia enterocolitica]|uniref:hypothetical protein n=1 Tax=Yersinia enterocolitica TaxID=630 RepID=UPI0021E737B2|nr:hypothetical protein [Yersinia enterocolitica]UYJ76113.1 hypothetical protein N4227_17330 [Yersinia enterocolitica]
MSKIERYTGNLRAFGSNAQGLERTLFGEETQGDDLTSQVTNSFLRGWGIVGPSENPSMEDFNAAMYTMSQFIAYQHQMGIPEWDALQEYYSGSICVRAGETYSSLVNGNVGSAPPSVKWTPVLTTKNGLENLGLSDVAHLPQLTGVVGTSRNAKMSVTSVSATATFTADELIVQTALGGLQYKLSNFSKTINLVTTGAGGMDTGAVPANGFVALYAIYNPTTQISALLAVNASSVVAPEVYGGSNMPAGYTASALVSVLPTSASQLAPVIQQGRRVSIVGASILSGSGAPSSLAALAITVIPLNTTLIRISATVGIITNDTTGVLEVAASAALVGAKRISLGAAGTGGTLSTTSYMEMPVADNSRNIYWRIQSANISYGLTTMGYEF